MLLGVGPAAAAVNREAEALNAHAARRRRRQRAAPEDLAPGQNFPGEESAAIVISAGKNKKAHRQHTEQRSARPEPAAEQPNARGRLVVPFLRSCISPLAFFPHPPNTSTDRSNQIPLFARSPSRAFLMQNLDA